MRLFAIVVLALGIVAFAADAQARCVGLCYGVRSVRTGLPRNTYVHSYVRRNGTVVQAYTRSR